MLQAKERTPTPSPSIVITFGLLVESIKEFWGASLLLPSSHLLLLFIFMLVGLPFFSLPTFLFCTYYCFLSLHLLQLPSLQWLLLLVFMLFAVPFFMLVIFPLCTC
jgi:hypothetical protein